MFDNIEGHISSLRPDTTLSLAEVRELILRSPAGKILALGGVDSESLRFAFDQIDPNLEKRRVLFVKIEPASTINAIIDQILDLLAQTALSLWPLWFTDISFAECHCDAAGKIAAGLKARKTAKEIGGVSPEWAETAVTLAIEGKPPRVVGTPAEIELKQLALTINRYRIVLLADVSAAFEVGSNPNALVYGLEWIAQHSNSSIIILFRQLPANKPPFDRILYRARQISGPEDELNRIRDDPAPAVATKTWLVPWCGSPHPLSEIEQRLAKALGADVELGPLFRFNQIVKTARGSQPKVDLVWTDGRLIVELDGYGSHGNRLAFMYDRHRDYELTLSGYTVLRLANDEIEQDMQKTIEKIRDLVTLCRQRTDLEM